ncbi:MAG: hypothetical protein O7G87_20295 [bacterium]|nr:hypothetical protein [bacterium]
MKLSPATLLVLTMFGSFVVVLGALVIILRPASKSTRPKTVQTQTTKAKRDSIVTGQTAQPAGPEITQVRAEEKKSAPEPPQKTVSEFRSYETGRQAYREIQQMRKDMARQKSDLEKRLKSQIAQQKKKIAQMARWCEPLEPGEAVLLLEKLDDETIASVLRRMKREKALPIAALLKRLGREKAIAIQ